MNSYEISKLKKQLPTRKSTQCRHSCAKQVPLLPVTLLNGSSLFGGTMEQHISGEIEMPMPFDPPIKRILQS